MKTLLFSILVLVAIQTGFAQGIDQILSPLPSDVEIAKHEGMLIASLQTSAEAAPAAEARRPAAVVQRTLKGSDVLADLGKQISDYYALKGSFKLDFARPWQPVKLPGENFELVLSDYPENGISSAFLIRCKVLSGGETVADLQLSLHAQLWQEVWGALSKLDRGQALNSSLVAFQKVDVLRDKQTYLSIDVDPAAYDMAQAVQAGRALTKRDVIERPVVHKGQVVDVVAHQGLFNVRMKALAMEDGGEKAIIRMRNLETRKDFNAQIINENQVEVHF